MLLGAPEKRWLSSLDSTETNDEVLRLDCVALAVPELRCLNFTSIIMMSKVG